MTWCTILFDTYTLFARESRFARTLAQVRVIFLARRRNFCVHRVLWGGAVLCVVQVSEQRVSSRTGDALCVPFALSAQRVSMCEGNG